MSTDTLPGLCARCDVFIGFGALGVARPPQEHADDREWLADHCWVCKRSRQEIGTSTAWRSPADTSFDDVTAPGPLRLDIGGGLRPMLGHVNVDPVHGQGTARVAMPTVLPIPDGTVEAIRCSHVMEHIPAGAPRIDTMNEFHRLLRPGGLLTIIVPIIGTWHAIADPTHVSLWVPESFNYFDGSSAAMADYGIRPWTTLDHQTNDGWEHIWTATPVKG